MGKRKTLPQSAESSDDDLSDSGDEFNASKTRKKSFSTTQRSKKRTKRDLDAVNDDVSATPPSCSLHSKWIHVMKPAEVPSIRAALVQWYSTVHSSRSMPWRKPYDPTLDRDDRAQRAYEVWISEIMLQQTQVATVIPYYNRWLEKFPTIRDLAGASIDEVNALWKGLGYYSRASRLLAGAKKAVDEYGGRLPDNAKDMQANIPGIGRYSAGAICSIAYGENVPVASEIQLDGNVNRLLSRVLALHAPPKAKATLDILWNAASAMVHGLESEHPGDVNQALIELGSTVCKVRDPSCAGCPLQSWCAAYTKTTTSPTAPQMIVTDIEDLCKVCEPTDNAAVTAYPMRVDKKKAREELDIVNVIEWRSDSDRQFLLVRRPEGGLLAGLDEFPTSPNVAASLSRAKQAEIPQKMLLTLLHPDVVLIDTTGTLKPQPGSSKSLRITKVHPVGDVVHVFSHIKKTYRVQWVLLDGTLDLPRLNDSAQSGPSTAKSKGKKQVQKADGESEVIPYSRWVPLDEVATKNCLERFLFISAILNLSGKSASDAEIHERHRSLSLLFHPDKHPEDSKSVAAEKFLEIQKAYEVLADPFLRTVYDSLGEPGLAVNWLEETRTRSSEELQQKFQQIQRDWLQNKVDATISPRGRVVCKVDASALFIPYQGLQEDTWPRRFLNRLEDVRLLSFSLRHDIQKRITERSTASLAARISRGGASGRGNFMGTLRHQYSRRLAFEVSIWFFPGKPRLFSGLALQATSSLLPFPYDISLKSEYQNGHDALNIQTTIIPGKPLAVPPVFISVTRQLFGRPDSAQGRLEIDLGRHPQVSIDLFQEPLLHKADYNYILRFPVARTRFSWSYGFVLNDFDPKLIGEWGLVLTKLSLRLKLHLECGVDGLAWLFSGSWENDDTSVVASLRLSQGGVGLKIVGTYLQQTLSIPILLSEEHNSSIALWTAAVPVALCASVYHITTGKLRRRRARAIRSAIRALQPDSPVRQHAEAVVAMMRHKARDSLDTEATKGGLVIVQASYEAMEAVDRELGLSWDVTVPLQTSVRGSQIYISGRHSKSSIPGFLDPAPFTLKALRVRYLFRGRMHYAEVPEYLSLVLPLAGKTILSFLRTIIKACFRARSCC
ncbi:hypothetical protein B0H16DRAFT_1306809 [Mycena metata]|uniref:Adenine DNA glycosylase n=1 Tax=Mycena metata TaxID=1033252 RepID=A0AAD7JRM5_9AGAR|nr:hypothetical protein B0H16DRAFT_1306809 [Mycena metata]